MSPEVVAVRQLSGVIAPLMDAWQLEAANGSTIVLHPLLVSRSKLACGLWRAGVADAAGCELDGSVEGEALSEFHLLCLVALDDVVASESAALGPLRS